METSIFRWFPLLWQRNAELAAKARRFVLSCLAGYLAIVILGDFLSAFGLNQVNWAFLAAYLVLVLSLPFNLLLWEVLIALGFVAGQPGGEEGPSVRDGVATVREWASAFVRIGGLIFLVYGAFPFIWLAENNTEGAIGTNLGIILLIPTTAMVCYYLWPKARTVLHIIAWALIVLIAIMIAQALWNTIYRATTDPAAATVQGYNQWAEEQRLKEEAAAVQKIADKLRRGVAFERLTPDEKADWKRAEQKASKQSLDARSGVFLGGMKKTWNAFVPNALEVSIDSEGVSSGKRQTKELTLSGSSVQEIRECGFENGSWKYELSGDTTVSTVWGGGQSDLPEIKLWGTPQNADPTWYQRYDGNGGAKYHYALLANGKAPGETVKITNGCVTWAINVPYFKVAQMTSDSVRFARDYHVNAVFTHRFGFS